MAGRGAPGAGMPLNVPPVLASNFELGSGRAYSRDDATPTWEAFEEVLGGLEGGQAVAFASGMGSIAAVFDLLPVGATVALGDDCYHAVAGLAAAGGAQGRWRVVRVGVEDTSRWLELAADADLLWLESPSNPLLAVADLPAICAARHKPDALIVVDSTFATPLVQRPLELGADLVVHSATKYLGGHSDLLLGGGRGVRRARPAIARATRAGRSHARRARGLPRRPWNTHTRAANERASATAAELAERLAGHADVAVVRYPGRPDHPTHETARSFMARFGAVVSFDVGGRGRARRGRLPVCTDHPPCHESGRRRVDHRTPSRHSRAGPSTARTAAAQRRVRTSRRRLVGPRTGPYAVMPHANDLIDRVAELLHESPGELRDAGVTNELNLQGWLGARNLRLAAADPREPEISPGVLDRRAL